MIPPAPAIKKRILFVDDEQRILDGLRTLLRRQRNQWDMAFASGGVRTPAGMLVVARGYVATPGFVERVRNFAPGFVKEPIRVVRRG